MHNLVHPFTLDWGNFTADGYNADNNEALHIFNFEINNSIKIDRVSHFVVGRLVWGSINLPRNCFQKILFDIRGQNIQKDILDLLNLKISKPLHNKAIKEFSIHFKEK
jgi:hypothetical protein